MEYKRIRHLFHVCSILKSMNMLLSNNECYHYCRVFCVCLFVWLMSPPTCIIIPLHAKAVTKVVDTTSTPSHFSRSLGYDYCILPFIDDKAKECIKQVSDKKVGMEDDRVSYGASTHDSILTTLNVLITLRTLICASKFPLVLPSMSKKLCFQIFRNASIDSFMKPTWILEIQSRACWILGLWFQ